MTFNLEQKEQWHHKTNLFMLFDRDDEKTYQSIKAALRAKSKIHKKEAKDLTKNAEYYEYPKDLVEPILEFYEENYYWKAGEYTMKLYVTTDFESANVTKYYRFTIFEFHLDTLKTIKDYYKYGGGIIWQPEISTAVNIEVKKAVNY